MTFDTLLMPTDGSEPAETAARRGFDLAEALGASVHVLSVADSSIATGAGYAGDSPSIRRHLRELAEDRAGSLRDEAVDRGLEATAAIREGIPAREIGEYADDRAVDAIVIGTAGRGGLSRAIVGSVADKVVRTAPVPVVTIPPAAAERQGRATIDSVLLPTDGSEPAMAGARRGLKLAAQVGATVHALSVTAPDRERTLSSLLGDDEPTEDDGEVDASLERVATEAVDRGLEAVTTTLEGVPAEAIVDYAASADVDLIAMGTAGRGGFERTLVGSVTDDVIRTAPVPILTVRPTDASSARVDADSTQE